MYCELSDLLNTNRGPSELCTSYETRFLAQMSKFNAHSSKIVLPEYIFAFLLLSNVGIDASQRIAILFPAVSPSTHLR